MGKKVRQFEEVFAQYIGTKHGIMVNSGSSANLLALSVLTNPDLEHRLRPGDEVITPAITWATTVYPIVHCGLVPVLVDVELKSFNLDPEQVERAISSRTRAIMLVHLLGNPCEMDEIMEIARRHNLLVIEDSCEAHGAEYHGKKVGSFGTMSTFSFFFAHHVSTIEGGMVLSNNDILADWVRAMRVFGWIRDRSDRDALSQSYPDIDPRYLFVNLGFNMRPTEVQGGFGIHQMGRLEEFIRVRRENAAYWTQQLSSLEEHLVLHRERPGTRHVWYGYPITVKPNGPFTRRDLMAHLEARGVETRPIMAGNILEQPVSRLFRHRRVGDLPNSRLIHRQSFFFGSHHGIDAAAREALVDYISEFINATV
jgi:CDP-6-deoxy-D-xylo-4-hexulose-3-dehydrase